MLWTSLFPKEPTPRSGAPRPRTPATPCRFSDVRVFICKLTRLDLGTSFLQHLTLCDVPRACRTCWRNGSRGQSHGTRPHVLLAQAPPWLLPPGPKHLLIEHESHNIGLLCTPRLRASPWDPRATFTFTKVLFFPRGISCSFSSGQGRANRCVHLSRQVQ